MTIRQVILPLLLSVARLVAGPANDDFTAAQLVAGELPQVLSGSTVEAGSESDEPLAYHSRPARPAPRTIWWRWTVPSDSWYLADVRGSAVAAGIDVFRGANPGLLTGVTARGINTSIDGRCLFEAVAGEVLHLRVASFDGGVTELKLDATPVPGRHFSSERPKLLTGALPLSDELPLFPLLEESDIPAALASQQMWWEWQAPASAQYALNFGITYSGAAVTAWREQAGSFVNHGGFTAYSLVGSAGPQELILTATAGQRWRFSCRPTHDNAQSHGWTGWARLSLRQVSVLSGGVLNLPLKGLSGDLGGDTTFRWVCPSSGWYMPVVSLGGILRRYGNGITVRGETGNLMPLTFQAAAGSSWTIAFKPGITVGRVVPFTIQMQSQPDSTLADNFADAVFLGNKTGIQSRLRKINPTYAVGESVHPTLAAGESTPRDSAWCRWTSPYTGVVALRSWRTRDPITYTAMWSGSPLDIRNALPALNYYRQRLTAPERETWYAVEAGRDYWIGIYSGSYYPPYGSVELEIERLPFAENDHFASATPLTGTVAVLGADALPATWETGEPPHPNGDFEGSTLWWRWTVPVSGIVSVDDSDPTYSHYLHKVTLHRGESLDQLSEVLPGEPVVAGETLMLRTIWTTGEAVIARVWVAPPPVVQLAQHDMFSQALNLPSSPQVNVTISTVGATLEEGEAGLARDSVWAVWRVPSTGHYVITGGIPFTGQSIPELTPVPAVHDYNSTPVYALQADAEIILRGKLATYYFPAGDPVTLAIAGIPRYPPPNDGWDIRLDAGYGRGITVNGAIGQIDGLTGVYVEAGFEAGEPEANMQVGDTGSVWYDYQSDKNGVFVLTMSPATHHAEVYHAGPALAGLAPVAGSMVGPYDQLIFPVVKDARYHIAVSGPAAAFTFYIRPATAYETWVRRFPELSGPDLRPEADPRHDGYPNLMKMALGLDPRPNGVPHDPGRLPQLVRNGEWLELRFRPDLASLDAKDGGADARIDGQATADPSLDYSWRSLPPEPIGNPIGNGLWAVRFPIRYASRQFLRLCVEED